MSKYQFQRYPEVLTNDAGDTRVVNDQTEAEAAEAEGFKASPSPEPGPAAPSEDVAKLKSDLDAAEQLIAQLDEAGARVAAERDEALKALDDAKSEIERLRGQLNENEEVGTADNSASIKAELDALGVEYDGRLKDPVKLAKILSDAKTAKTGEA